MKFIETPINGLFLIELEPYQDERGHFFRVFCENEFEEVDFPKRIAQINQSLTRKSGTVRGMHFQYPPKAEIKIVKCISGSIYDVAIDLRKNSQSFLKWHGEVLSEKNEKMLYIPEGFAHGFQTLENDSKVIYFVTEFYYPEYEGGVLYNDPKIKINWPLELTNISDKDRKLKLLEENFMGL